MIRKKSLRRNKRFYKNQSTNFDSSNDGILDVLANTVGILILIGVLGALAVANSAFEIYAPMNRDAKKYIHLFHASEEGIWDVEPSRQALIEIDRKKKLFKKNCQLNGFDKSTCLKKSSKFHGSGYISNVRYVFNDSNQYVERSDMPTFRISAFSGVGIRFEFVFDQKDQLEGIKILKIYENTPASKSKLIVGDIIHSVNGKTLTRENIISRDYGISGPRNTIVSLGVKGKGNYNIRRDYVDAFYKTDLDNLENLIEEIKKQDKAIYVILEPSGFKGFKEIQKFSKKYEVELGWDAWDEEKKIITFGEGRSMTVQ